MALLPTPTLAQNTLLHRVAGSGTAAAVIALLEHGANIEAKNEFGETVFDLAEQFNRAMKGTDAWRRLKIARDR